MNAPFVAHYHKSPRASDVAERGAQSAGRMLSIQVLRGRPNCASEADETAFFTLDLDNPGDKRLAPLQSNQTD
jgi:hypothetical protein